MRSRAHSLWVIWLALAVALPLHAQPAGRSTAVRVAITDTLTTRDARALVLRDPTQAQDLVILRRATATPEILGVALALVDRLRAANPTPANLEVAMMQGGAPQRPFPAARMAAMQATLDRIAAQALARIGALGPGQWAQLPSTSASP